MDLGSFVVLQGFKFRLYFLGSITTSMVDFSTATQRSCVTAPASPALDPTEGKGRTLFIYLWRNTVDLL